MGRALAHIQQQWHINHGQEIYCVKLASSVSMLDADRVCSSDRGVVSHLSMPPLVLTACASNLFLFFPLLLPFYRAFFAKLKPHLLPGWKVGSRGRCAGMLTSLLPARWARGFTRVRGRREHLSLPQRQHGFRSRRGRENDMKQMQIHQRPGARHFLVIGHWY